MKRRATALALLLLILVEGIVVHAHGGGELVAGPVQTGPYTLSVWVNPPQPRADEALHFTVGVAAPIDSAPVLDAQVLVTLQSLTSDAPPLAAPATTAQSINRLFYEMDMTVVDPGRYQVTVDVTGTEGEGRLSFELDVGEPSSINWFYLGLGGLGLVLVLGWWRSRRIPVR